MGLVSPWHGALRKLKKFLLQHAEGVPEWRRARWQSTTFSGEFFEFSCLIDANERDAIDEILSTENIQLNGFLLADFFVAGSMKSKGGDLLIVHALLMDDEITEISPEVFN